MYQSVSKGETFFRVPEFVTRNSLYYTNYLFKNKPFLLQAGVTFKYFSKYYLNDYDPLLSEFILQNDEEFGGYPLFDIFVNVYNREDAIKLGLIEKSNLKLYFGIIIGLIIIYFGYKKVRKLRDAKNDRA